jgi:heat shock protein HslJ
MKDKKNTLFILGVGIALLALVAIVGMYKFNYLASLSNHDVDGNKVDVIEKPSDSLNTTYSIEGEMVALVDGVAEVEVVPGATSKVVTKYFGNEVQIDLNDDGREDKVFLLTQNSGGSGTFFYVVAAINTENGWLGSKAFLLGDRIAPQSTEVSQNPNHKNVIVINYMDRASDEAMSEQPTIGNSVWLKLDVNSLMFGTVEQVFSGEASAERMTLDMKQWTWVETVFSDGSQLVPSETDVFGLTFTDAGTFSATTDCNSMGGTYEVSGNTISFGSMFATEMFCMDSQEHEFATMLSEVDSFDFTGKGELIFGLKSEGGSSVFK